MATLNHDMGGEICFAGGEGEIERGQEGKNPNIFRRTRIPEEGSIKQKERLEIAVKLLCQSDIPYIKLLSSIRKGDMREA